MSDKMTQFMKASAESAQAKTDWLAAHDNHLDRHDKRLNWMWWVVIIQGVSITLVGIAVIILGLTVKGVI